MKPYKALLLQSIYHLIIMTTTHENFMSGESYFPNNPLLKLRLTLTSCYIKEPSYYQKTEKKSNEYDLSQSILENISKYIALPEHLTKSRLEIFHMTVNDALNADFKGTIDLAKHARVNEFFRTGPALVIALAAQHEKRVEFNNDNPMYFRNLVEEMFLIPGDMITLLDAWKSLHDGSKTKFPSFLKRTMSQRLDKITPYQAEKYRKKVIDSVRISHPRTNVVLDELMESGKLQLDSKDKKWEALKAQGNNWLQTIELMEWNMPHKACVHNLRGFANEVRNEEHIERYCEMMKRGVKHGKLYPFHYITAYQALKSASTVSKKAKTTNPNAKPYYIRPLRKRDFAIIIKALEECIQLSIENFPKLEGDVVVLSDNSGSAHGAFTSEYGSTTVAEIGNLSAIITANACTGRGMIGLFGDRLLEYEVDKSKTILQQYDEINILAGVRGIHVGGGTENGLWLFYKRSMENPDKYRFDHFFCYSDMQAGHGGLYGIDPELKDWEFKNERGSSQKYIDLLKLLENYRNTINPRMSCFTVQTAGYNDSIMPENLYRGAILAGWTGREVLYADKVLKLWDEVDAMLVK